MADTQPRPDTYEAVAIRDAAKADLLRRHSADNEAMQKRADEAQTQARKSQEQADKVAGREVVPDLAGAPPTLSDANGAFADDAKQAQQGGTGVVNSNSSPKPADNLDDAEAKAVKAKIAAQKGGK